MAHEVKLSNFLTLQHLTIEYVPFQRELVIDDKF